MNSVDLRKKHNANSRICTGNQKDRKGEDLVPRSWNSDDSEAAGRLQKMDVEGIFLTLDVNKAALRLAFQSHVGFRKGANEVSSGLGKLLRDGCGDAEARRSGQKWCEVARLDSYGGKVCK